MDSISSVDLLDSHADALLAPQTEGPYTLPPGDVSSADPDVADLMALAEHVQALLAPISPSLPFVDRLRYKLARAAAPIVEVFSPWQHSWIIGATAVGSVLSLLGLLQFLRGSRRTLKRAS